MARIFISYRRDDAGYVASMVRQRLEADFGAGAVFMDIDNIPLGVDFRDHLSDAVANCDILVALIGETWAGPQAGSPQRRIEDPQDFVRIEIEAALKRGIPVVPVLIDKAQLPAAHTLPETLRELPFRNAAELRAGRDLDAHLDKLSQGLHAHLKRDEHGSTKASNNSSIGQAAAKADTVTAHPSQPGKVEVPVPPAAAPKVSSAASTATATAPPRTSTPVMAIAGLALVAAAITAWWALGQRPGNQPQVPTPSRAPSVAAEPTAQATPVLGPPVSTQPAPQASPAPATEASTAAANPSLLDGYKIAIFFPSGDTAAANTARAIRQALAARGVQGRVELRLATEQRLRELIPPEGLEVRFDEGREGAQARLLAEVLAAKPLGMAATLKPVPSSEPTPNFISVFVPKGG
jgi:TIR domain